MSLAIFGMGKGISTVSQSLIDNCKTDLDAILLCVQLRKVKYSHSEIAARCGIDKGRFSRILSGQHKMSMDEIIQLVKVCENFAPYQYMGKHF